MYDVMKGDPMESGITMYYMVVVEIYDVNTTATV